MISTAVPPSVGQIVRYQVSPIRMEGTITVLFALTFGFERPIAIAIGIAIAIDKVENGFRCRSR
jgi:hypothetical protein